MKREAYRYQRTIARATTVRGVGYLTGASVRLEFQPAPPSAGVVFVRTDLPGAPEVPARIDQVTGSHRRTVLGRAPVQVSLVEHVLAALAGLRIDNCRVCLDAPEPPGLDGSAREFVERLRLAGAVLQPARRTVWRATQAVTVRQEGATLTLHPGRGDALRISYLLDYGLGSPLGRQIHTLDVSPETFANHVADCRTFLLEAEAEGLRRQGFGPRTTSADLLVFGRRGPINNRLRHADEPARHKILDLLGDLSLLGHDVRGHLVAYRSGHPLNAELVRVLTRRIARPQAAPCARLAA